MSIDEINGSLPSKVVVNFVLRINVVKVQWIKQMLVQPPAMKMTHFIIFYL